MAAKISIAVCMQQRLHSYELFSEEGRPAIRFLPCRVVSFHPQDVLHRFCAKCGRFLEVRDLELSRRGTGRTTEQINSAPDGAVFICTPALEPYVRDLAKLRGRDDLKVHGTQALEDHKLKGLKIPAIVVDHSAWRTMGERAYAGYLEALAYVGRDSKPGEKTS